MTKSFKIHSDDSMSMNISTLSSKKLIGGARQTNAERGAVVTSISAQLPLPDELLYPNNLDWSIEDQGLIQKISSDFFKDGDIPAVGNIANTLKERIKIKALGSFGFRSVAQAGGISIDPLKEIFFNGSHNRVFNFSWRLAPKSSQEAKSIEDMYKALMIASLPETSGKGLFQIPDEFQIQFPDELKLPKIKNCVCNDISLNFVDGGQIRFQNDGYASFMKLSMQLTEIEIAIKGDFE